MNRYELTYIIDIDLEETSRKELIEKFNGLIQLNGGEVEKVDETWGRRKLAYPINDKMEGYYVMVTFKSEGDLPREIERNLEINDSVMRYLIIKQLEKKQSVKPRPIRVQAPVAAPAAAVAAEAVAETVVTETEQVSVKIDESIAPEEQSLSEEQSLPQESTVSEESAAAMETPVDIVDEER